MKWEVGVDLGEMRGSPKKSSGGFENEDGVSGGFCGGGRGGS